MNLGVFLAIGESLEDFNNKGQLKRLIDYNIKTYLEHFDKVFIFSYKKEKAILPKNCILVPNKTNLHRYIYSLLLPIINKKYIKDCQLSRGLQLSGGLPALISKILFGKKFIINYGYDYSSFAKIEGKIFQSFLYKLIQKPILGFADAVMVTSIEIKKQLEKIIDKSKIIYIPNGVDLNLFRPINKKSISKILNIFYVGRLERQKNLINLIKALAHIKKSFKLTFLGQGSQKKELIKLANRFEVSLTIKNPVDYLKLPKILSRADIFILPSLEEGSPKSLLEAMACGVPVIGTNVKGIKELIDDGKNGILSGINDYEIAEAIKKLKDPVKRRRLSKEARLFVEKKHDLHKLLSYETNLLKKLAT